MPRNSVPARCNAPATLLYANGYRACLCHRDTASYPAEESRTVPYGPCDYPQDGLGAARLARRTK